MKYFKTVAVYILNDENMVLMLKHKKHNKWLPPGGSVEDGELAHEAAIREVKEESGIDIEFIYDQLPIEANLDERARLLPRPLLVQLERNEVEDFVYLAKAVNENITNNEGHEIGWHFIDDALKLDIFDNVKIHLEYIRKRFINGCI